MSATNAAVVFVVLAVVLSVAEIVAPGFVLLPFGLGAGLAAILGFFGAPPLVQGIVFLVGSFGFYLALRPLSRRLNDEEPTTGIGASRLIGTTGTVLERIAGGETGLVRIDREEWRAESSAGHVLMPGMVVRVLEVRGTRVLVEPEHSQTLGREEGSPA